MMTSVFAPCRNYIQTLVNKALQRIEGQKAIQPTTGITSTYTQMQVIKIIQPV